MIKIYVSFAAKIIHNGPPKHCQGYHASFKLLESTVILLPKFNVLKVLENGSGA